MGLASVCCIDSSSNGFLDRATDDVLNGFVDAFTEDSLDDSLAASPKGFFPFDCTDASSGTISIDVDSGDNSTRFLDR